MHSLVRNASISAVLLTAFGLGSYVLLLIATTESIRALFFEKIFNQHLWIRIASDLVLVLCSCLLLQIYFDLDALNGISPGGLIGESGFEYVSAVIGTVGTLIFIVIFFLSCIALSFNFSWLSVADLTGRFALKFLNLLKDGFILFFQSFNTLITATFKSLKSIKFTSNKATTLVDAPTIEDSERVIEQVKSEASGEYLSEDTTEVVSDKKEKIEKVTEDSKDAKDSKKSSSTVYKAETTDTTLPGAELLDRALDDGSSLTQSELNQIADLLETKLQEFNVEAKVVSVLPGPVITRFEIQPAPGTKASRITNISQDIARSLAVSSVRVVEVIEGKSVIGIEIPNTNRKMVRLSEIIASREFTNATSPLSLALGHDISGKSVVVDLAKMPHLLVAGTTGSGKSVGINAMLLSLLFKSDPTDVRLILIDPKMLELSVYDGIPHLLTPVITDMTDASNGLRWCVAEMDRRYKLMSEMGVRNLAGFNKKVNEAKAVGKPLFDPFVEEDQEIELEALPSIVVVVDEFADMMMLVGKKVEHLIARIAQKARAAGIHLILATQRPSVDVITGLIKANIPTRIGFQVSSKIDSRTILDQGGAEQLLGSGDMLYLPAGQGIPVRVHGAFVGDDEVHRVVNDWKERSEPDYLDEITSELQETGPIPGWSSMDTSSSEDSDELYDEAVNFVIESRRASISAVQRKLRIGYNRAARLIEAMEEAGLVSEMNTNGTREVLVPKR
jgi:S-DNA-T family DNA segregation ATPase FtsK/SpoIIIE